MALQLTIGILLMVSGASFSLTTLMIAVGGRPRKDNYNFNKPGFVSLLTFIGILVFLIGLALYSM